jgi:FAD/FMN-containing dehydrogenase
MPHYVEQEIAGWGNYHTALCRLFRPEQVGTLRDVLLNGDATTCIPRGLGRSYGDSAVNTGDGVILCQKLNRFLAFNLDTGIVECEGGVSFAEIIEHLLPRGFFLPVTPGTKFVTVGGAIAADVHGKNHHCDGTFSKFLLDLKLMTATGEVMVCSPELHSDVFWATVGGMGLTGVILSARIQLVRVPSAYIKVRYDRAKNIDHAIDLFTQGNQPRFSVAWIDCLASGKKLGRCVLMRGDFAEPADLSGPRGSAPFKVPAKRNKSVPKFFPAFALNRLSIKAFNILYYAGHKNVDRIVDYDTFFYPLDNLLHWNRMYGKRGFVQYQALLPTHTARGGMRKLLERLARSGMGSFLAVLKATGPAGHGLLSFPYAGFTLALDLPNTGQKLSALLTELDQIVLENEGRLYLAKDATMSRDAFEKMYPLLGQFREICARLDPQRRLASTQSRRLGMAVGV